MDNSIIITLQIQIEILLTRRIYIIIIVIIILIIIFQDKTKNVYNDEIRNATIKNEKFN